MMSMLLVLLQFAFAQSPLDGVQSGRYEIHRSAAVVAEEPVEKPVRKPAQAAKQKPRLKSLEVTQAPSAVSAPSESPALPVVHHPEVPEEPTLAEQAQKLVEGNVEQVYNFYREQVHPDDPRNNRVEVEIKTGYFANDSKSNYSYREYSGTLPTLGIDASVWLTPMIGLGGQYMFSLTGDITGNRATSSRVSAHYEFLDLSFKMRYYFGLSRKSSSIEFDLLYTDSKMNVPSDNTDRLRTKSSGLGLGLKARMPRSASFAWTAGASLFPRINHTEDTTGLIVQSGSTAESVRVGLDVGGEFKFSRIHQITLKAGVETEKNLFQGNATQVDPLMGQTPSNVSVTNTLYMLTLGYRWGQ